MSRRYPPAWHEFFFCPCNAARLYTYSHTKISPCGVWTEYVRCDVCGREWKATWVDCESGIPPLLEPTKLRRKRKSPGRKKMKSQPTLFEGINPGGAV